MPTRPTLPDHDCRSRCSVSCIVATATAVLVTAAAPSAAIADFHFVKPIDKASPTIYQDAGSSTSGTTAPPAK